MAAKVSDPERSRQFALEVVSRLRGAGFPAFWAGGCVRDELLGRIPADYDVATSARPAQVREVFGHRRTLSIGAAFGVITVLGPPDAGQVEVATFRTDAAYTDGRHPAGVIFSSPEEDAMRRDFTINGLFFDPLTGAVHDYVGGRDDLAAGVVRAIGVPAQRFGEDHLRMLRAVRFAAGFGFSLDGETAAAVANMAHLVATVSPERIAAEFRGMLSRPGRRRALALLAETGLARHVFPEVAPSCRNAAGSAVQQRDWDQAAAVIDALDEPELAVGLAALFDRAGPAACRQAAARLRLSNAETRRASWLLEAAAAIGTAADAAALRARPWSQVQPWLAHPDARLLADLLRARAAAGCGPADLAAWVSEQVVRPEADLDPAPLLSGAEMLALGLPAGPAMGRILAGLRQRQLDEQITSREAAIEWVRRHCSDLQDTG